MKMNLGFLKFISKQKDTKTVVIYVDQKFSSLSAPSQIKILKKGVFITTAKFTKEAENFAKDNQNFSVVLIDGDKLAELMIKYKVGVQTSQIYEICKIDTDFFEENNF